MTVLFGCLCVILSGITAGCLWKIRVMRKSAEELTVQFEKRIKEDTNVGIEISSRDSKMRQLALGMDRQIRIFREEQRRYLQGNQELKDAAANFSHDLRTPMTAAWGYLDLLKQEEMSEEAGEYLQIISERIQAMKELTEEMFQYSKIGSRTQEYEKISLNRMLEETAADFYGVLTQASIEPEIRIPEQQVFCYGNPQSVKRILANLFSNGVKYSRGDLEVVLKEDGSISFSNRAPFMDPMQVGFLMERFYTVENGERSSGLGLHIVKVLAEEMNGKVSAVYDRKAGKLRITVLFPAATCG